MNRALAYAITLASFAAPAQAADLELDKLKAPIPNSLSWQGITVYGTIDVGFGYKTHGAPWGSGYPQGVGYNIYSAKYGNKAISSLDPNALEPTKIGLIIEEAITSGWVAIGRLEMGFDPLSGQLADGPGSLLQNAGVPLSRQSANGDSSRQGQTSNGPSFAGVSSKTFGTMTVGRQQSLQLDQNGSYDPQGGSYAFSLLGWSSSLAGAGISAAARQDDSVKYVFQYGPFHAAGMYAEGGPDVGFFGPAYGANLGGVYGGFSIDAVYQKVNAGVQLSSLTASPASGVNSIYLPPANYSNTALNGLITDNDSLSVQAKYTLSFEEGAKDGGLKDGGPVPDFWTGARLTLFAGFEDIRYHNSSADRDREYIGQTVAGGYRIGYLPAILGVSKASSLYFYASTRELQLEWTGARYELASGLSFTAAYYHLAQNAFSSASVLSKPQAGSPNQQPGYDAGEYHDASFVVDYRFNKHWDIYAGVNYSTVEGGLASGFLANDNASVITGTRLKF